MAAIKAYTGRHIVAAALSIENSRTYFARVANEGLKSSKLGLLTLL